MGTFYGSPGRSDALATLKWESLEERRKAQELIGGGGQRSSYFLKNIMNNFEFHRGTVIF